MIAAVCIRICICIRIRFTASGITHQTSGVKLIHRLIDLARDNQFNGLGYFGEYLLQRQREGIELARRQGKYEGRKPIVHPDFDQVCTRWRRGELTAVQAMKQLGMSKSTFYRKVRYSSSSNRKR